MGMLLCEEGPLGAQVAFGRERLPCILLERLYQLREMCAILATPRNLAPGQSFTLVAPLHWEG